MILGFVDDIDIIGIDERAVEDAVVPFESEIARIDLITNTSNTNNMIVGRERGSNCYVIRKVVIGGESFKIMEEFMHNRILVTIKCYPKAKRRPEAAKVLSTASVTN